MARRGPDAAQPRVGPTPSPGRAAAGDGGAWLAIDTATDITGIALCTRSTVLGELAWPDRVRRSDGVAPAIRDLLVGAGVAAPDLAGIAVAIGPGSYTGLRVGLSIAKGMALANRTPLVGVPTLDPLAAALSPPWSARDVPLLALMRAGRGRYTFRVYPADHSLEVLDEGHVYRAVTADLLLEAVAPPAWVAGEIGFDAQELARSGYTVVPPAAGFRRGAWLAQCGRRLFHARGPDDPDTLEPDYPGGAARAGAPPGAARRVGT